MPHWLGQTTGQKLLNKLTFLRTLLTYCSNRMNEHAHLKTAQKVSAAGRPTAGGSVFGDETSRGNDAINGLTLSLSSFHNLYVIKSI